MLFLVAIFNARVEDYANGGGNFMSLDFRLGSRLLSEEGSGGTSLRWDNPFTEDQMRHGAVILHILLLLYMFTGLAIVCDDYFCSALDEICIKLAISDDVAGATFMAAGGSAPEFFTSLLGVFFFESDVGFGTIVGSAVFNVLFVIGLCAYFSGFDTLPLTWYPLARDSSFYLICLGTLLGVSNDRSISWVDSLVLCLLYVLYVTIIAASQTQVMPLPESPNSTRVAHEDGGTIGTDGPSSTTDAVHKFAGESPMMSPKGIPPIASSTTGDAGFDEGKHQVVSAVVEDDEGEPHDGPPEWPDTTKGRIIYVINAPLNWGFYLTIPDCRLERLKKYYLATFSIAVLWIGALSYVMLVMAEDIGNTLGAS
ncbi:MAG: hypothetical protein SGPRY_003758 [Prymnesium sp.]